ncbi:uncharacterized protein E6C27_scaffold236G00830 [Cucumis melo var. makuwa]|uniref:Uncharacterized protein n=1 Tax=Cucumis melo var. makuwa TaxID=1194695 RepID=A0A5A7TKA8_CUCMM|nr:uncharacterized protein E6C27_scaffold236G00830 [Cucumis melo var. makuwa]
MLEFYCVLIQDKSEWAVNPVLHDVTAVAGSGLGGLLSAVHAYNTGIPHLQSYVKGPKWLPFVIGVPALLLCSSAGATFGDLGKGFLLFSLHHSLLIDFLLKGVKCPLFSSLFMELYNETWHHSFSRKKSLPFGAQYESVNTHGIMQKGTLAWPFFPCRDVYLRWKTGRVKLHFSLLPFSNRFYDTLLYWPSAPLQSLKVSWIYLGLAFFHLVVLASLELWQKEARILFLVEG